MVTLPAAVKIFFQLKNGYRAVSNGSRGFDPYAHRRDENPYQQRSRNPYDDLPDSEDEYDSELDDFIDDEDDEVGEAVARKLVRFVNYFSNYIKKNNRLTDRFFYS